ncbi:MAG: carbon-nitrogen hydrolase family protein [Clostridiaceae bacterium]
MKNLRVALLQLLPEGTLQANLEKGLEACRNAKELGADIALFPELWSIGYRLSSNADELKERAIPIDGEFVRAFAALAKELEMAIGITFLEEYSPAPRNTLCLFDRFGKNMLTYAKVHTCDFDDERLLTAGDDFPVAELDTAAGTVKVGAMICYDREFPESARILMLNGAELLLVPNACPMEINRISQLRARAFENMLGIATVNYPKGHPDCNGNSTAFDGIAYKPSLPESRDTLLIETGEEEGICFADFPMDEIRDYRQREVHGNAYRHPQKYHLLVSQAVEEPFIRPDCRR